MKKRLFIEKIIRGLILYLKNSQKLDLLPEVIRELEGIPSRVKEAKKIAKGFSEFLRRRKILTWRTQILRQLNEQIPKQAAVTTAFPLTPFSKKQILHFLNLTFGLGLEVSFSVEREILGGVIVRINHFLLDGSLLGQAKKLREKMAEARI